MMRLARPEHCATSEHDPQGRRRAAGAVARVAAAVGLSALLALGACSSEPDVIKIGVGQPLTGPLAALGQDMVNGVRMAVDEINAVGGVRLGTRRVKMEVVTVDDKSDAKTGIAGAQSLVAAGVTVAVAHLNSGVSIAAAKTYAEAGVPQLAISTNPAYTQQGLPTTLRLVANDTLQAKALGSYAGQLPGAERFAVVDDGTPYGKGLADAAAKELTAAKKEVLLRQTTDDKTTDFGALVDAMGKGKVDVLVAALNDFQIEAIVQLVGKAGMQRLRIIGGDTVKTDRMAKVNHPAVTIYATSPIVDAREFQAGTTHFLSNFRKRFGSDPVYGAHYAYDTVYLVADAMTRNKSADRARLLQRLKDPQFDGNAPVTGFMRFGADGEQRYSAVAVYLLRDGVWQLQLRSDRW